MEGLTVEESVIIENYRKADRYKKRLILILATSAGKAAEKQKNKTGGGNGAYKMPGMQQRNIE